MNDRLEVLTISREDVEGGAARAAYRLHRGLLEQGVAAKMLVQRRLSDDSSVLPYYGPSALRNALGGFRPLIDAMPSRCYRHRNGGFWSSNLLPEWGSRGRLSRLHPAIAHAHWVGAGFLTPGQIMSLPCPVVWTLHDMWAFTGGCHYDAGCGRYRDHCGHCPQLGSACGWDISRVSWQFKRGAYRRDKLLVVCPSRWLARCAGESSLLGGHRIEVIPNGLDLQQFKPLDKTCCRSALGLPLERHTLWLAFGAMSATSDPRKGFPALSEALQCLAARQPGLDLGVMVFGAAQPAQAPDFGFDTYYLGRLHDDISMATVYSAADAVVAPSNQENLSNVVLEALACGTPVVAFDIGGMPDLIDHQVNGYLARANDATDLADGLAWVLQDSSRRDALSTAARNKAEREFDIHSIVRRYRAVYESLLDQGNG